MFALGLSKNDNTIEAPHQHPDGYSTQVQIVDAYDLLYQCILDLWR